MKIDDYLARIHFEGEPRVDINTLRAIHHQHLLHIPYENLDVQLGRPLDFDLERIFDKIVTRHRGGWCYEMNGLLGWALGQIGFNVRRMAGAVMREEQGDGQLGNHLVLEVVLDQPYLADVGLGDGLREPVPIKAATHQQGQMEYRLESIADNYFRFHNQRHSNVPSFDFKHETANEQLLADKCHWLQTAEESPFKLAFIAQRFTPSGYVMQLGKMFTVVDASGKSTREIDDIESYNQHMVDTFGLQENFDELWPRIEATHERLFGGHDEPVAGDA
jgi:N-hydroxyarylamine O-acetyltransferase